MTNPDVSEADVPNRTCTYPNCDRKHKARGLCDIHYFQWRTTGEVKPIRKWAGRGLLCRLCGTPVPDGAGSRRFCSDSCRQADFRTGGTRPTVATCAFCRLEFSLVKRNAKGYLQRIDTIWCPDCGRDSPDVQRFKRYGVTRERYEAAMSAGCSICLRIDKVLHVDHDHACCPGDKGCCGKCVRGFICGPCNRGLGLFFDNPAALRRAADYLDTPP